MKGIQLVLLLSIFGTSLEAARILVVTPMPFYSHTATFMPVLKELAKRGHQVTMVSPFPQKEPSANWTDIAIDPLLYQGRHIGNMINRGGHLFYPVLWDFCIEVMNMGFRDKTLNEVIRSDVKDYDLLILESYFCQEPLIALGHKLNVPVVVIHAFGLTPWYSFMTGNEVSFQLHTNIRSSYTDQMTFWERLDNILINLIEFSIGYFKYLPEMQRLMDKFVIYPGSENRPPLLDMLRNVSLTLMDYHFSVGYAEPIQPNSIPVGGLSLKNAGELPKEFKDIMDNAKDGVIYMSFGSVLSKSYITDRVFDTMVAAFGELKQTVFMKWDDENLPNVPKNVYLRKWLPQAAILAHPNLRIFITHAGLHSTTEASYFGVPVVVIPFFADQTYNAKFLEQAELGVIVTLDDLNKENVLTAINKVLINPRYKENAVIRSDIVKDRPDTALQTAVYWVEYVLRHGGARHLRPARADLTIYQILGIDVLFFVGASCLVPLVLIRVLWKKRVAKTKKD